LAGQNITGELQEPYREDLGDYLMGLYNEDVGL